jgi:hypothetical protein
MRQQHLLHRSVEAFKEYQNAHFSKYIKVSGPESLHSGGFNIVSS